MSSQNTIHPIQPVIDTDFEVGVTDASTEKTTRMSWKTNFKFLLAGMFFGILLVKSELVSWYRIQEMFRFQSFHLYGVMASGIAVGAASVAIIKKFKIKTFSGEPITFPKKPFHKGNIFGGLLFGFGWAMTGACPGPLYALVGTAIIMIVPLLSALAGTWVYGLIRDKLPH